MTLGQKISEFIIRAETYVATTRFNIAVEQEEGGDYEKDLYRLQDLYAFLVELQTLYNQWTEREILIFIDYWDDECSLKTLQGIVPDPYKYYENATSIITQTTSLVVPDGIGLLYRDVQGNIVVIEDADEIISDYGLPTE